MNRATLGKVLGIRKAEEKIIQEYHKDTMKTPMHMSWGEEACVVGIYEGFPIRPIVFGTYRSHAVYLAASEDYSGFFGELLGKTSGSSQGRGGSMHLSNVSAGVYPSSAIVGGNLSVAVGAAHALREMGSDRYTLVFFGDGAADSGTFWESLNLAATLKARVIFACLDNDLAVHTDEATRRSFRARDLGQLGALLRIPVLTLQTANAFEISSSVSKFASTLSGPAIIHAKWYRFLEHVGIGIDFEQGYREKPNSEFLESVDPVKQTIEGALKLGFSREYIDEIEKETITQVSQAFDTALQEKESEPQSAMKWVFA